SPHGRVGSPAAWEATGRDARRRLPRPALLESRAAHWIPHRDARDTDPALPRPLSATVRIGTCSWADEALSKWFYPPKLPAKDRLAWYAEHYDTVEVDSTFYRLPSDSMVQGWAERTPDGFTMHVKAFGLMTRPPVQAEGPPADL